MTSLPNADPASLVICGALVAIVIVLALLLAFGLARAGRDE